MLLEAEFTWFEDEAIILFANSQHVHGHTIRFPIRLALFLRFIFAPGFLCHCCSSLFFVAPKTMSPKLKTTPFFSWITMNASYFGWSCVMQRFFWRLLCCKKRQTIYEDDRHIHTLPAEVETKAVLTKL